MREANLETSRRGGCVSKDEYCGRTLSCFSIVRAAGMGSWASTRHPEYLTHIEGGTDSEEKRGRKSGEIPGHITHTHEPVPPHQRSRMCISWAEHPLKEPWSLDSHLSFSFSTLVRPACSTPHFYPFPCYR